jgi:hypothetical protein
MRSMKRPERIGNERRDEEKETLKNGCGTESHCRRMQAEMEAKVAPGWATGLESRACDDPKMTRPCTPVASSALVDSASMREH